MLVISRRKGQRIVIGDDIELVVTDIHRSAVRIGIVAPRGSPILRGEVHDSILAANREAASSSVDEAALVAASLSADPSLSPVARLPIHRQSTGASSSQNQSGEASQAAGAPAPAKAAGPDEPAPNPGAAE
jgi:carbon storage regulator